MIFKSGAQHKIRNQSDRVWNNFARETKLTEYINSSLYVSICFRFTSQSQTLQWQHPTMFIQEQVNLKITTTTLNLNFMLKVHVGTKFAVELLVNMTMSIVLLQFKWKLNNTTDTKFSQVEKKYLFYGFRCLLHMEVDKVYEAQWLSLKIAALFYKALYFLLLLML